MAHEEALIKLLERKVADGEKLIEIVSKINNVNGVQSFRRRLSKKSVSC